MSNLDKNQPTLKTYHQYLIIWIGQLISLIGSNIVQFVMIWWITIETQSAVYLSLATFFGYIPSVILSPFTGVLADKVDRQKLIILADFLQAFVTLLLICSFYFDMMQIWIYFLIISLRSIFQTLQGPAKYAIVSQMVPKEKLARLNGLDYFFSNIMSLIGAPIAALLLNFFDIFQLLFVDIITFLIAIIPFFFIRIPKLAHIGDKVQLPSMGEYKEGIKEGFQFLRRNVGFFSLILTASFVNFFIMPFTSLLAYYINVDNGGTEQHLALVMMAQQAGLIFGGLITTIKPKRKNPMRFMQFILTVQFIGFAIIGLAPLGSYWIMSLGMFVSGMTFPFTNTIISTIFQKNVPNEVQGRISTVLGALSMLISPIGMIISGPLANLMSTKLLFIVSSLIPIIAIQFIWKFTPIMDAEKIVQDNKSLEVLNNPEIMTEVVPVNIKEPREEQESLS
ncbi:MFS transporter [Candidatus Lokiarchaeum ossiferum]|uniref:MFS transporter n=1 Tax=Candidatus Lokiarchaeum ossiferum TaxID=2951803 RepID=UPI00352F5D6E